MPAAGGRLSLMPEAHTVRSPRSAVSEARSVHTAKAVSHHKAPKEHRATSSGQFTSSTVSLTHDGSTVDIYYELRNFPAHGRSAGTSRTERIVMIMGFAASSSAWLPLLNYLQQRQADEDRANLQIVTFDNRGIGYSSSPSKEDYSTTIMARDTVMLMDHLGWNKAHIVGFSMGGMIAMKFGAIAPERVQTLTVVSATGGGTQAIPRRWRGVKFMIRGLLAKTAEKRAYVDIKFHYSSDTLRRLVPNQGNKRTQEVLMSEYVAASMRHGMQSEAGRKGQMAAVWHHKITSADKRCIKAGNFPVWFIHGRHDLIAMPEFAERLAARFGVPCIMVNGAHLIVRENASELGAYLLSIMHPRACDPATAFMSTLQRASLVNNEHSSTGDKDRLSSADKPNVVHGLELDIESAAAVGALA